MLEAETNIFQEDTNNHHPTLGAKIMKPGNFFVGLTVRPFFIRKTWYNLYIQKYFWIPNIVFNRFYETIPKSSTTAKRSKTLIIIIRRDTQNNVKGLTLSITVSFS